MSKERGTFLIEFTDGSSYVFGNNYKPWWLHAREYIYYTNGDQPAIKEKGWHYDAVADVVKAVKYSNQPFYDDGGLKYCSLSAYQEIIDDVCSKEKLAPVNVSDIVFDNAPIYKTVLTKKLKEY